MIEAKVIQVIQTIHTEGAGTKEDPKRVVNSYWSLEGDLLAVNDPRQAERKKNLLKLCRELNKTSDDGQVFRVEKISGSRP